MNINGAVNDLVAIFKPPAEIPYSEAQRLIREHISPHNIRRLHRWMKRLRPEAQRIVEERGPEWVTSPEGWKWLQEQRQ